MKDLLVGSTGLVGSNLLSCHSFSLAVHSKDVNKAFDFSPDLCLYAGIPSQMFLANKNPDADLDIIKNARKNLRKIRPKKLILISTVAVYSNCEGRDETFVIDKSELTVYGRNRLQMELWVREDFPNAQVVRLPALYGKGLKKNFLYDLHHIIPRMLTNEKYKEINKDYSALNDFYVKAANGYFVLKEGCANQKLKDFFLHYHFNALSFTDSRSRYQFYNLYNLWNDIQSLIATKIPLINFVTPPVLVRDIYNAVTGRNDWRNELNTTPYNYNLRSIYMEAFGKCGEYLCSVQSEIEDICHFMKAWNESEIMY